MQDSEFSRIGQGYPSLFTAHRSLAKGGQSPVRVRGDCVVRGGRASGSPLTADASLRRSEWAKRATSGRGSEARVQAPAGLRPPRLVTFDGVTGAA